MTNSVSFSSELNTLFLIEETQVVAFPLASKKGILVSKVEDQLVAATFQGTIIKRQTKVIQIETDKSQIQFYYSNQLDQAFIIIIDAEFDKDTNPGNYTYRNLNYDLNRFTLVIKRVENKLTFYSFPKKINPVSTPDPSDIG